ncbi:mitochondrial ribosomal protein L23 [Mycena floridula]|nr:mitochondrial ribosomal protein L23 [Mycena floridula]
MLRRLYSTGKNLPTAQSARTASTPLAVRERRERKSGPAGRTDATSAGLSPTDQAKYDRLKALGALPARADGKGPIRSAVWHRSLNARRSRIRGIRKVQRDGVVDTEVVGVPIFLPNIVFKLVRNQTPVGEPYNPFEATFRLPLNVTKSDIRSYLLAVYGVETTYIRTDVHRPPMRNGRVRLTALYRQQKLSTAYKRAVVGLKDPFYYPLRMEDMNEKDHAARELWLEDHYGLKARALSSRAQALSATGKLGHAKFQSIMKKLEIGAVDQVSIPVNGRGNILKKIAEQRTKREEEIQKRADRWSEMRQKKIPIQVGKARENVEMGAMRSTSPKSFSQQVSSWVSRL